MIYFLRRENGDIKIGTAKTFSDRLNQLRVEHGELELLGAMVGGLDVERSLHEQFHHARYGRAEWFAPVSELLVFIQTNTQPEVPVEHYRPTRTVRVYETTAVLIDQLVRRERGKTVADVVESWAKQLYPRASAAAEQVSTEVDTAIDADEGATKKPDKTE
jgi:hypothetical protein